MRTPASIAHHPIHPMLIPIPVGLWLFSLACDLFFVLGAGATHWATVSFWTMLGGLAGAVVAAIPGVIDMLSLRGTPKRIALVHGAINVIVVVLYAMNFGMRLNGAHIAGLPLGFSILGVALLLVSGWLGGHLIHVHRVSVVEPHETRP